MSWFKKEVEDWDMAGKALQAQLNRGMQVVDLDIDDEEDEVEEIDLVALRRQAENEKVKTKKFNKAVNNLLDSGE